MNGHATREPSGGEETSIMAPPAQEEVHHDAPSTPPHISVSAPKQSSKPSPYTSSSTTHVPRSLQTLGVPAAAGADIGTGASNNHFVGIVMVAFVTFGSILFGYNTGTISSVIGIDN